MRADPVHPVIEAFAFLVQITFDNQGRIFVGDYPKQPVGRVLFIPLVIPVGKHLRGSGAFIPWTERAESAGPANLFHNEVGRSLASFLGNDDPAAKNRIFS
jgi:hypothetical protein